MPIPDTYQADLQQLLDKRHDNGADYWATPDGRWGKGSPFSTFDCALMLHELGMKRTDPVLKGVAEVILGNWREDGRFRSAPKATLYPCHTANATRVLCRIGYARDRRLKRTFEHLLETQHVDGGWRCNSVKLGRGFETDASNPGVTLSTLDAFRFTDHLNNDERLTEAVETVLDHWTIKRPMGPCSFGIGTLFGQVEYPFRRYNLFFYVYVLSFYEAARKSPMFREAFAALEERVVDGKVVVENPNRRLARLALCERGKPSRLATKRYREILKNLAG